MRLSQVLAAVLAMSSTSVALSDHNLQALPEAKRLLYGRDDNSKSNAPASTQPPQSSASASQSNKDDKSPSTSAPSRSVTGKPDSTSNSSMSQIDPRLPAGGVSMITPAALVNNYYKIGDYVTFAWNFTSLSVTPTAIDIMASCTANHATYTIAVNQSADQTQVVWDTAHPPSGQAAFITENYKILIYDADSSVSAAPKSGYLAPYSLFSFGMYIPQERQDWADWKCPTCNSANSHFEKMTITALLMTTGTTIGSLLYFSYTFGVW